MLWTHSHLPVPSLVDNPQITQMACANSQLFPVDYVTKDLETTTMC